MQTSKLHTESQETRNHELSTVAHSTNGTVLDDNTLVGSKQALKRTDNTSQVRFVALVIHHILRIQNVVERNHSLILAHRTATNSAELLHVRTHTKQQSQVDAKRSDIGTSLAADPEDTQMAVIVEFVELGLVDGTDTELALDGGNQWRTLEQRTGQSLEGASELGLATGDFVVESDNANVFLSGALLRLDETSGTVDTDDKTASDLGIQSTAVTSLLRSIAENC